MPRKVTDHIKMFAGACALTVALVPMSASAGPSGGMGGMGGGSVNHVAPMPRPTSGIPRTASPSVTPPRTVSPSPAPTSAPTTTSPITAQPDTAGARPTPESPLMANPDIKAPGPETGTRIRKPIVATPAEQRERHRVPPPGGDGGSEQ